MNSDKKISFGFSKVTKKSLVIPAKPVEQKKVELVECLEGQSIKIKDAVEVVNEPLVIPIKDNKKNLLDRIKDAKAKQKHLDKKETAQEEDNRPDSELTIEELAARELINDAKHRLSQRQSATKVYVVRINEEDITLDGEAEPTLDDYENVPISDYGLAMLRGMGWKEGLGIGKNPKQLETTNAPELRPKGLGLGATKMVKAEIPKETACDKDGKALILKRGTLAKIIAGSHKGNYCEVQGLDDEGGRVIVKTSLKNEILTLNEFLIIPVSSEEYSKGSKVLNNAKYEVYKEMSDKKLNYQREGKSNEEVKLKVKVEEKPKVKEKTEEKHRSRKYSSELDDKKPNIKQEHSHKKDRDKNQESKKDKYCDKRSKSSHKDKERESSSSEDDIEVTKHREKRKGKSSRRDRSRSREDRHKHKKKASKSKHRSRSSSGSDSGREKSRKNKSKSRQRKSSSSDDGRRHRKNKR